MDHLSLDKGNQEIRSFRREVLIAVAETPSGMRLQRRLLCFGLLFLFPLETVIKLHRNAAETLSSQAVDALQLPARTPPGTAGESVRQRGRF
ncbi:hypothetical protein [Streptomyces coeruleorubidus]|uniref:hypothetical protein n=1 Tax=Streptomyces coeruleorubidus TaxID=116188 RepID=UPI0033A91A79